VECAASAKCPLILYDRSSRAFGQAMTTTRPEWRTISLEEEVIELVARKTGKSKAKITPGKTFYDLGIDGDDTVELIAE